MRKNRFAGVHHAQQIGVDDVGPRLGRLLHKRSDGSRNRSGADQNIYFPVMDAHAIDGRVHLLKIGDIGANAERVAAGVFDLQMRQVQLRLAARQQRHSISGSRKSDRQPFADAASGSSDEHTGVGQSFHRADTFQSTLVQRGHGCAPQ